MILDDDPKGIVMGTTAVDLSLREAPAKRTERRFFSVYTLALAAIVFAGFAPSFYLRGIVEPYRVLAPLRPEVVVHAILATAFILMFPLQSWLIATNRRALHMKTGKWGFVLGVLMLPAGYVAAAGTYHAVAPLADTLGFTPAMLMAAPLPDLVLLAVLLAVAWRYRFDMQAHKRFMVLIACGLTEPAISRLPLWPPTGGVIVAAAIFATVLPLWAWDLVRSRRLHWATILGSAALLVLLAGRPPLGVAAWWAPFVAALPGFGPP